jgi:hypothetical protein
VSWDRRCRWVVNDNSQDDPAPRSAASRIATPPSLRQSHDVVGPRSAIDSPSIALRPAFPRSGDQLFRLRAAVFGLRTAKTVRGTPCPTPIANAG